MAPFRRGNAATAPGALNAVMAANLSLRSLSSSRSVFGAQLAWNGARSAFAYPSIAACLRHATLSSTWRSLQTTHLCTASLSSPANLNPSTHHSGTLTVTAGRCGAAGRHRHSVTRVTRFLRNRPLWAWSRRWAMAAFHAMPLRGDAWFCAGQE